MTGTHDGGAAAASLSDSTAPYWPYSLVDGTVYNITDGSSGTITAAGTSITASLAGGGSNDWNNGEVYFIVPPDGWAFIEPFCFELPTIARNGAAADCSEISVRLLNQAGEGVIYWQQVELLENLFDNPSLETGAGNPWIPSGWTNDGLDPGDAQASSAGGGLVHSGSDCVEFTAGAVWGEGYLQDLGGTVGKFVAVGQWSIGDDDDEYIYYQWANTTQGTLQYDPAANALIPSDAPCWLHTGGVGVIKNALNRCKLTGAGGAAITTRYIDDVYQLVLDDVSLTVTPASEANSLETSGLRVDGWDQVDQSEYSSVAIEDVLDRDAWVIEYEVTPRHDAADVLKFGHTAAVLLSVYGNSDNYILVKFTAASTLQLAFKAAGGTEQTDAWSSAVMNAGTTYKITVKGWQSDRMQLFVNGVLRATINQPFVWNYTPDVVHWGHDAVGVGWYDATFDTP